MKPRKQTGRTISQLKDLRPDPKNANKGTQQGGGMVEKSLRSCGAGRSILIDKHGTVIAGNKTLEGAASIGLDDVIVVQTDGTKLVAVQRTDLDLSKGGRARELAIFDNRAGEVGLDWNLDVLKSFAAEGLLLDVYEFPPGFIETPDFAPVGEDEQGRLDQKAPVTCPGCGLEFVPK